MLNETGKSFLSVFADVFLKLDSDLVGKQWVHSEAVESVSAIHLKVRDQMLQYTDS